MMGEVADDMIDGLSCSDCGVYFEQEHGHPVLCSDCFNDSGGKPQYPLATNKEL